MSNVHKDRFTLLKKKIETNKNHNSRWRSTLSYFEALFSLPTYLFSFFTDFK